MLCKTEKKKSRDFSNRKPDASLLQLCPWGQTMGIPSIGPLWLSASSVSEAVLSAWDAAVLPGRKMRPQFVNRQDEGIPEGLCRESHRPLSALWKSREPSSFPERR